MRPSVTSGRLYELLVLNKSAKDCISQQGIAHTGQLLFDIETNPSAVCVIFLENGRFKYRLLKPTVSFAVIVMLEMQSSFFRGQDNTIIVQDAQRVTIGIFALRVANSPFAKKLKFTESVATHVKLMQVLKILNKHGAVSQTRGFKHLMSQETQFQEENNTFQLYFSLSNICPHSSIMCQFKVRIVHVPRCC